MMSLATQIILSQSREIKENQGKFSTDFNSSNLPPPNVCVDLKKIQAVNANIILLETVKLTAVCCNCGKIMYPHSICWANDLSRQDWKANDLVPQNSPVYIETKQNKSTKKQQVSVCQVCLTQLKKGSKIDCFDDFGEIPQCIKQLKSFYEYCKLSIGNLWCNTYKPRGYTYLHSTGMMNVCRNSDKNLRGMIGMLQEGEDPKLKVSHSEVCNGSK